MKFFNLNHKLFLCISCFVIFITACKKETLEQDYQVNDKEVVFPITDREKELASLTKEIGSVLDTIYLHHEVLNEVNAAIYSGFEPDESISIKNLLQPNNGELYHFSNFTKQYITPGSFFKYFKAEVSNSNYPLINKYYGDYLYTTNDNNSASSTGSKVTTSTVSKLSTVSDSALLTYEIWVVNSVRIYFPYSENFSSLYYPNSPRINQTDGAFLVTKVTADRDADTGPGKEPYVYWPDRRSPKKIKYNTVTVSDAYCEVTPTHIVNVDNGTAADPLPPVTPPPTTGPIYKVWVSWVRCTKQYDRLISLTGNGCGSEIYFSTDFAVQNGNGQVSPSNTSFLVRFKRKDIRKKTWVHPFALWNTNWKTEQTTNNLGIWEDDTQSSKTFGGSVSGKFKIGGVEVNVGVNFSHTITSNDPVIRNLIIDRDYFFRDGANNQGFGFQDSWPIRDGNSDVSYTMPYQIIP